MKSLAALGRGMLGAIAAATMLAAAVAITWFGPAKGGPRLSVTDGTGASWCGTVKETAQGQRFGKLRQARPRFDWTAFRTFAQWQTVRGPEQ